MTSVSLMEWNGNPPLQWDLENLMMFNAATTENPKKLQAPGWDVDGERGFDSGSLYSSGSASGAGSGRGGSGSDLGLASFSKSSKSASNNSSSTGEVKTSNFGFEACEAILEDSGGRKQVAKAKPIGGSPTLEASVGSGEPLLGLKLGKRMYFEDACAGSNAKTASFSVNPVSAVTAPKKSKSSSQVVLAPHCQVEGCNLDLSSAKDYHRKHRVCESHSKCPKVIVGGLERRFCQQCSRFHALSEFDEKKRSCRRRLSDHNARRRKPQPEPLQLSTARLSSSLYGADERQQMSLIWNRAPTDHSRLNPNSTWEDTSGSKFTITKEYIPKPSKVGGTQQQLHLPRNELTNLSPIHCHDSNGFLTSKTKGTPANVLNQGIEESIISSNVDATQDLHRALSLLSNNNTWGSCEQKSVSLEQPMSTNHSSIPQSVVPVIPQGLPIASPDFWRTEHQSIDSKVHSLASHNNDSNYFQEFQLSRGPYEGDFYSSQLN